MEHSVMDDEKKRHKYERNSHITELRLAILTFKIIIELQETMT